MKIIFNVEGMSCRHCVNAVTTAVEALPDVKSTEVDLETKTVTVEYDGITPETIMAAIEDQGYDVSIGESTP